MISIQRRHVVPILIVFATWLNGCKGNGGLATAAGGSSERGPAASTGRCGDHSWCDTALSPGARAGLLLAELTREEKISLLAGDDLTGVAGGEGTHTGTSNGVPRVDLPTIYYSDGPMGVRSGQGTAMPAPIGLAATWDPQIARRYGALIANEARHKGNDVVFAPTVNIARLPQNGRTFEGYGEDPYLVSRMAVGWIEGAHSEGLIANVKHYAANNQEGLGINSPPELFLGVGLLGNRLVTNAVIDERTLREIYLPAFEAAVKEAHVGSVMCSYNRVNGAYACENEFLLKKVLREDWGFSGYVLADYGAAKITSNSLNSGLDFDPWPGLSYHPLLVTPLVTSGAVSAATLDERVRNVLRTLFAFGALDRPAHVYDNEQIDKEGHARAAGEIEEQAITLLKNDGVLPLDATQLHSIAIIGADADRFQKRGGSAGITPFFFTTPREKITERAGPGIEVRFDAGDSASQAAATATGADVALVFVSDSSIEGADRTCLSLNCPLDVLADRRDQDGLIEAVAAANPNTVVVLETGAPVLTPWRDRVKGMVEAWIPGSDAGTAIARVLFGDVDPGGRLPVTFPNSEADLPTAGHPERYPGIAENAEYSEGVFVGYRWFDENHLEPAFPFGHGLSYTRFRYSDLRVSSSEVSAMLTNTGARAGSDVAQLYIGIPEPAAGVNQPPRQLKGFQKVRLAPGQSATVRFPLDSRSFAFWDVASKHWNSTPGCYSIGVGPSSRELPLQDQLPLGGAQC